MKPGKGLSRQISIWSAEARKTEERLTHIAAANLSRAEKAEARLAIAEAKRDKAQDANRALRSALRGYDHNLKLLHAAEAKLEAVEEYTATLNPTAIVSPDGQIEIQMVSRLSVMQDLLLALATTGPSLREQIQNKVALIRFWADNVKNNEMLSKAYENCATLLEAALKGEA